MRYRGFCFRYYQTRLKWVKAPKQELHFAYPLLSVVIANNDIAGSNLRTPGIVCIKLCLQPLPLKCVMSVACYQMYCHAELLNVHDDPPVYMFT